LLKFRTWENEKRAIDNQQHSWQIGFNGIMENWLLFDLGFL
jgi:hypothetical protein